MSENIPAVVKVTGGHPFPQISRKNFVTPLISWVFLDGADIAYQQMIRLPFDRYLMKK